MSLHNLTFSGWLFFAFVIGIVTDTGFRVAFECAKVKRTQYLEKSIGINVVVFAVSVAWLLWLVTT